MRDSLIIGRYLPYDSFIHKLDPRSKLITTLLFVVIILFANNWATYLLLTGFVVLAIALSKISFAKFINGVKPMLNLLIFTAMIQVLFTNGRTNYFSWWIFTVSQEGIERGIFMFIRFVLIIFISLLLTLSTEALKLTDAIENLMSPLKIFGISVHEPALMLSIAMRFVPIMFDEANVIMDAQRARGMDFTEGNLIQKVKNYTPLLIPLFNASFDRAVDLANAMDSRNYRLSAKRTKYRELNWHLNDTLVLVVLLLLAVAVFLLRA